MERQPTTTTEELLKEEGNYIITKQPDGNYVGETNRFGTVVTVRAIGPETVLQMLLTHSGTKV